MKKVLTLVCLVGGLYGVDLKVTIHNTKEKVGNLVIGLYKESNQFPKKPYKKAVILADKTSYTFKNLQKDTYAVAVFQDKNLNDKIDKNFIGIPIEPYGFSNDAKGFMGPPSFEDAKFELKKDRTIPIKMENQ